MKKVLFITNVPSPYRLDFFNELGKEVDLTVAFETSTFEKGRRFNASENGIQNFKAVFLSDEADGKAIARRVNKKVFPYLKKGLYDYTVITNYSYATEMACILKLKFRKIPYYMETDGGMPKKENVFKRALKRFLLSGAKGYFSPGAKADDYLVFYGAKREKIYRYPFTSLFEKDILTSLPSAEEKQIYRKNLGIKEKNVILSVGQFVHRKGFDVLLTACQGLDKDTGVYIIGGEATEEYLRLKKELKLENVYFVGFCDKKTLDGYYRAADVFVLPTREDIWGLVVNEAMARGLPVVTTDKCVAGLELVQNGKNGYLVPAEDKKSLRQAIDKALAGANRVKMGENSLKKIAPYTFENEAQKHMEIFQE